MRLSNWVGNNLHLLECEVDEEHREGNLVGIRFTDTSQPIADVSNDINPVLMTGDCTMPRCEGGKHRRNDGSYGICYRCEGRGYITEEKAIKNREYDKQKALIHKDLLALSR